MRAFSAGSAAACPFSGARVAAAASPAAAERPAGESIVKSKVSRRSVLGGMLAAAATTAFTTVHKPVAAMAARRAMLGPHGGLPRGLDVAVKAGRTTEARFGLMFKNLPAYAPADKLLRQLAAKMNDGKQPLSDVKDSDIAYDMSMPAGYVYLGQFIDHDMTRDKTPLTKQRQDVRGMINYDTPSFDLGSVYGAGPAANPELYDSARPGYLRVNEHDELVDLPRDAVGAAYLGDPRNDENLIVAQLHTVFLRLHNTFRDQGMTFEQAKRQTQWHFQWVILHDYLPRIVDQSLIDSLLINTPYGWKFKPKFYKPKNTARPYMPVEYSGAAYRFGHSMIRAEYEMQDGHTVPIFGPDGYEDLRGNRPIPQNLWVDWNYFFDIPGLSSPDDRNMARLIDTQISLPLSTLPPTVVARTAGAIVALSERNLLRGKRLGLPAGQDVAIAMGIKPLTNSQLGLSGAGWAGKAPLWYYVLKEAELLRGGHKLGPVGGRIVAEVIVGLLALDAGCYLNAQPDFNPGPGFAMGDLILKAGALDPRALVAEEPEAPEAPEEPEAPEAPEDPGAPEAPEDPEAPEGADPEAVTEPIPLAPDEVINPEATSPLPAQV